MTNTFAFLASLQILFGLASLPWIDPSNFPILSPPIALGLQMAGFGVCGAYLTIKAKDEGTSVFGSALLVSGATFAYSAISSTPQLAWLSFLHVDGFIAYLFWRFVSVFPGGRGVGANQFLFNWITRGMFGVGCFLLVVQWLPSSSSVSILFDRSNPTSLWSPLVYFCAGLSMVVLFWNLKNAPIEDRIRIRFFTYGLAAPAFVFGCVLPIIYWISAEWAISEQGRLITIPLIHVSLLALPLVTTFALLTDRAFYIEQTLKLAVRYHLAKVTATTLYLVPLFVVAWLLWTNRKLPLEEVPYSDGGVVASIFAAASLVAFLLRKRVQQSIDQTFFRESYDATADALAIRKTISGLHNLPDFSKQLLAAIDETLHVKQSCLVLRSEQGWVSPEEKVRSLPLESTLFWHLDDEPVGVEQLESQLDDEGRHWLLDTRAELLVPINDQADKLLGALMFGEKSSELEYTDKDRMYLKAAVEIATPFLQRLHDPASLEKLVSNQQPANACSLCDQVFEQYEEICIECGGEIVSLGLPFLVSERYECVQKLGTGSAGIAILARDIELDRAVVLKTLPQVRPELVRSLRNEARIMASLQHPNLTGIYDVESWRGMPILVMEYLSGGTLENKLSERPMMPNAAVKLGLSIFSALETLHAAGIVHRDLKPSNIGFDGTGRVKLLDFGFSKVMNEEDPARSYLAGTPRYLPPEIFDGNELDVLRDLWAASLTVFEALTGEYPFKGGDFGDTVRSIVNDQIRMDSRLADQDLAGFGPIFEQLLNKNPSERPQTASSSLELLRSYAGRPEAI